MQHKFALFHCRSSESLHTVLLWLSYLSFLSSANNRRHYIFRWSILLSIRMFINYHMISYTSLIHTQLHSFMRLISGCQHSTRSRGFWSSLMWLDLHFAAKQQATRCFRSLKPIQTGLFMQMCLNIHLLSLHPDTQFGQTQLCSGERTGSELLW